MRKNKLIEILSELDGNPEIFLWNGFVGDYQHISKDLVESCLVKQTLHDYLNICLLRARKSNGIEYNFTKEQIKELTTSYKNHIEWEENSYVTDEDVQNKFYKKKKVYYINARLRGIDTFDRAGDISY